MKNYQALEDLANKDGYLTGKKIVVALSGGIDSVVLLHFLKKIQIYVVYEFDIVVNERMMRC